MRSQCIIVILRSTTPSMSIVQIKNIVFEILSRIAGLRQPSVLCLKDDQSSKVVAQAIARGELCWPTTSPGRRAIIPDPLPSAVALED